MPRDQNGNYTLPPSNPVIEGTVIESDWANDTMFDLGNEITNSLSRFGNGGMLVPLRFVSGSLVQPGISWNDDPLSGFYHISAGNNAETRLTIFDTDVMRWNYNGVDIWDGSQFQPVVFGDLEADQVNYDIANQNLITADEVQGALDQLSIGIEGVLGGIEFMGNWDASTGNPPGFPELPEGGQMWIVSEAGNTPLPPAGGGDPLDTWLVGERVIYVVSTDPVGWVRLAAVQGITAFSVSFVPIGTEVPSDNVQLAIQDVNNRINTDAALLAGGNTYTGTNTFNLVPQSLDAPIGDDDLTRKSYVDTEILAAILPAEQITFIDTPTLEHDNLQDAQAASLTALGTRYNSADSVLNTDNVKASIDILANFLQSLVSGLSFEGAWDADDGELPGGPAFPYEGGDFWVITVAGTTPLPAWDGGADLDNWVIGDRAIYLDNTGGTGWFQIAQATVIPASQVVFDSVNFDGFFPTEPSPEQVQAALDFIWPILSVPYLPLTGGTLTGDLTINQIGQALDIKSGATAILANAYMQFSSDEGRTCFFGNFNNSTDTIALQADVGSLQLISINGAINLDALTEINLNAPTNVNGQLTVVEDGAGIVCREDTALTGALINFEEVGGQVLGQVGILGSGDTRISSLTQDLLLTAVNGAINLTALTEINLNAETNVNNILRVNRSTGATNLLMTEAFSGSAAYMDFLTSDNDRLGRIGMNTAREFFIEGTNEINLNAPVVNVSSNLAMISSSPRLAAQGGEQGLWFNTNGFLYLGAGVANPTSGISLRPQGLSNSTNALNLQSTGILEVANDVVAFSGLANEISMSDLAGVRGGITAGTATILWGTGFTVAVQGVGASVITLTTPQPDTNYGVVLGSTVMNCSVLLKAVGGFTLFTFDTAGSPQNAAIDFQILR